MWLLNEETARVMQDARKAGFAPTTEQLSALADAVQSRDGAPRNLVLAGNVAEIRVQGVLTKSPDWFAMYFGGGNTTYTDIITALAIVRSDASIKEVRLAIDSPGGNVDGLFDCLAAIELVRAEKKMSVRASNAQSAAYAIAAAAGKIEAANTGSTFGSIGTAVSYFVDDAVVTLTNTDSPDKRPDVTTPEGKATVVKFLDAVNELFVDAIARGRGNVASARVKSEFGRGATLLAGDAKRLGMIDSIAKPVLRAVSGAEANAEPPPADAVPAEEPAAQESTQPRAVGDNHSSPVAAPRGAQQRKSKMTEDELKAQHPDLYASVYGKGRSEERDRVGAHLTMGEQSGDLKTAFAAIKDGSPMTMTLQAQYMAAGMNRNDRANRQADSNAAAEAVDNAETPKTESGDIGDLLVARLKERKGGIQ